QRRREHVSRDACRHRNPERGETADPPFPSIAGDRREILVVKMIAHDLDIDLDVGSERDRAHQKCDGSRFRNWPRPTSPTNLPSRAATLPRTVTTCGRPAISNPSNEL